MPISESAVALRKSVCHPGNAGLSLLDERSVTQLRDRLLQLSLSVHHDRSVPGDRLLDRLTGYQQEADALRARLHCDLVAAVEQHQRAVADLFAHDNFLAVHLLFGEHSLRLRSGAERARALEHVGEGVPFSFDLQRLALARRHEDVEIARVGGDAFDRTFLAPEIAADDTYAGAIIVGDLWNLGPLDVLITRRGHLERRG